MAFGVMVSEVQAADVIVRDVNLGSCTTYTDGCNTHAIKDGVDSQTTEFVCVWAGTPKCLDTASGTDTQLTDMEKNKQDAAAKTLTTDFKLQTFNSCDNMESVMKNFIKDYYNAHPYNGGFYRGGGIMFGDTVMEKAVPSAVSTDSVQ